MSKSERESLDITKKFGRGLSRLFEESPDKKKLNLSSVRPRSLSNSSASLITRKLFSSKSTPAEVATLRGSSNNPAQPKNPYKFGAPLESLIEEGREIPVLLLKITTVLMTKGLDTEGLFFFDTENQNEVKKMKADCEKGKFEFTEATNFHHIAGLVRAFFLELPEPLMTVSLIEPFCYTSTFDDPLLRTQIFRTLVYTLPHDNRIVLQFMLSFIRKLASNSSKNCMGTEKLAKVFGKLFFRLDVTSEFMGQDFDAAKFLIEDYTKIFGVSDEEVAKYSYKDDIVVLKAATEDYLVLKIMDPYYSHLEPEFQEMLLMTYSCFCTNISFLKRLVDKFKQLHTYKGSISAAKSRIRLLQFMKSWIQNFGSEDKKNEEFMKAFHDFLTSDSEAARIAPALKHATETVPIPTYSFKEPQVLNGSDGSWDVLLTAAQEIAKQIIILDHQAFINLDVSECIKKRFDSGPTFAVLINRSNHWAKWTATEILKRETPAQRSDAIVYFIHVANFCRKHRAFNAAVSIIAGLGSASVTRLKQSWAKVPATSIKKHNKILALFDMGRNYKAYRDALKASNTPLSPYFALYPKYLTSIEETTPDKVEGMVNLNKLSLIFQIIKEIRKYQKDKYEFTPNQTLIDKILTAPVLDEKGRYAMSEKQEPRDKDSKEKETIIVNPLMSLSKSSSFLNLPSLHNHNSLTSSLSSTSSLSAYPQPGKSGAIRFQHHKVRIALDLDNLNSSEGESPKHEESALSHASESEYRSNALELPMVLSSPKLSAAFEKFLENSHAEHLLHFFKEVENYMEIEDPHEMVKVGNKIVDTYFGNPNDKVFIAIEDDVRQELLELQKLAVFSRETFAMIQHGVYSVFEQDFLPGFLSSTDILKMPKANHLHDDHERRDSTGGEDA